MKNIIIHTVLFICIIGNVIFSQQSVLKVSPSVVNIDVFSVGEISIQIEDIIALRAYSIYLSYDPQKLRCLSITRSTFFSNWQTFFYELIDSNSNLLRIDEAILGTGYENGSGELVKIQLEALTEGDVNIDFVNADLRDTSNNQIEIQTENGIFHITSPSSVNDIVQNETSSFMSYPNPFNSSTRIVYTSNRIEDSELNIYSITGEKVFSYKDRPISRKHISFIWNGDDNEGSLLPSGIYLLTAKNNNSFKTLKIILIK